MSPIQRHLKLGKHRAVLLLGPRGVGKSRYLKMIYPNAVRIDLLNDKSLRRFLASSEELESIVATMKSDEVLVIDEIQKAPHLLTKVHEILESDQLPKVRFVMTGSSARKIKKQGVDLLAGRAVLKNLFPFMASELVSKFKMKQILEFGSVPLVWSAVDPTETLDSYIGAYLKEEIKQEGLVRNLESFTRFLEVMCYSHGEVINLSNVAREASIKRSTLDGYLSILEDLLLGYRIQSFKTKNRKQTVESEKFYYFDVGVFRSLCPQGFLDNGKQFSGQALEGLVAQNLKAWLSYRSQKEKLYFWRTQAGSEVDFVVYGPAQFLAIEVKASKEIKLEFLSGLRSFIEDYPNCKPIFVYQGTQEKIIKGIHCIPVEKFLASLTV